MINKFIKEIPICILVFSFFFGNAFAQDVVLGGKAICTFRGKTPFRKVVTDGNRILLLQNQGSTNGSIQLQALANRKDGLVDVNILALLGLIPDVDEFLNGKVRKFKNNSSDLVLKKTRKKDGATLEVTNISSDESKAGLNGRIKARNNDNVAKGSLRFVFESSTRKLTLSAGEVDELKEDNGKVVVRCRFKDVPVEIKESE